MSIGRIFFIAIFVFSTTTLLTVSSALEVVRQSNILPLSMQQDLAFKQRQLELENNYKENLLRVLTTFTTGISLTDEERGNLENQLLALSVPANFQDLHFKLITSLVNLKNTDEKVKKTTHHQLEELVNQYSWLATKLSLFILNNF
jgi:hypothetical protein